MEVLKQLQHDVAHLNAKYEEEKQAERVTQAWNTLFIRVDLVIMVIGIALNSLGVLLIMRD